MIRNSRWFRRIPLWGWLSALILVKAMLFLFLLPPWQGPDEPVRLEPAFLISRSGSIPSQPAPDPHFQQQVLDSMRNFQAWRFYEREAPGNEVRSFDHANLPAGASFLYETPYSYFLPGLAIRWSGASVVLSMLYAARISSLWLHLATCLAVARLAFLTFPRIRSDAIAAAALATFALHPQLSFLAGAVHPDNTSFLLAALVLLLLTLALVQVRENGSVLFRVVPIVLAFGLAALSGYVIRKLVILLPFLAICLPFLRRPGPVRVPRVEATARILLVLLLAAFALSVLVYERPEWIGWRLIGFPKLATTQDLAETSFAVWMRYGSVLFSTFWMALGSLVHKLAWGWIFILGGLTVLVATGLGRFLRDGFRNQSLSGQRVDLKLVWVLVLWVMCVGLATLIAYGPHRPNPEGRYLLTAMPAIAILWTLGLRNFFKHETGDLAMTCCTAGMILLNGVVLFRYLVPIYYLKP